MKRGYFVLKDMLCEELVVPPDVDMVIEQDEDGATTIRERLQQHQTDTSCAPCHVRIDPLGFGFEHFDALGAWRDNWENGIPVDAMASTGMPFSQLSRQAPRASKCSKPKPRGSMRTWQGAQLVSVWCCCSRSRMVVAPSSSCSMTMSTSGGTTNSSHSMSLRTK